MQNLELFISIFKSVAIKVSSASKLSESITGKSSIGNVGSENFDFPKKQLPNHFYHLALKIFEMTQVLFL